MTDSPTEEQRGFARWLMLCDSSEAAAQWLASRDAERHARLLAEALRPFEELAELAKELDEEADGMDRFATGSAAIGADGVVRGARAAAVAKRQCAEAIRAALDRARKAQSGQDGGGENG